MIRHGRLLTAWLLLMATPLACSSLVKEREGSPYTSEIEIGRTMDGPPEVHIDPHLDDLGWTVHLSQPVRITLEQKEIAQWQAQRFVFWPPSVLIGVVQCPGSALLYAASFGKYGSTGLHYGCRRLLMQEPLHGSHTVHTTTSRQTKESVDSMPSNQATISVGWRHDKTTSLHYQPNEQGNVLIRVSHLVNRASETVPPSSLLTSPLTLTVSQGQHRIYESILVLSERARQQLQQQRASVVRDADPIRAPLIVEFTEFTGLPDPYAQVLRNRLTQRLLSAGLTIVADTTLQAWIQDEQQVQYKGQVADDTRVALGRWTPSTVVIQAKGDATDSRTHLTVTLASVRSGELVGTIEVEGAAEDWAAVILQVEEQLMTRLGRP